MESVISTSLKFGRGGEENESFRYPDVYKRQRCGEGERLLVGPSGRHVDLLAELADCLPEPLRLLYVLVVPRGADHAAARYESPDLSRSEIQGFVSDHRRFLESDGRHHLWVANPTVGTVVYDRHEILYAYGPIEGYLSVVRSWGMGEGDVVVPVPHWHVYHPEFDADEQAVLGRWHWLEKPLRDQDEA